MPLLLLLKLTEVCLGNKAQVSVGRAQHCLLRPSEHPGQQSESLGMPL